MSNEQAAVLSSQIAFLPAGIEWLLLCTTIKPGSVNQEDFQNLLPEDKLIKESHLHSGPGSGFYLVTAISRMLLLSPTTPNTGTVEYHSEVYGTFFPTNYTQQQVVAFIPAIEVLLTAEEENRYSLGYPSASL